MRANVSVMALNWRHTLSLQHMSSRILHTTPRGFIKQTYHAQEIDPKQFALLDEPCILVDENDTNIGSASKRDCHLMQNGSSLLHRAFSVFLFNSSGELLVHRRSNVKITFPGHFTNTCCSHPLYTPLEIIEEDAWGVRNAAQRRLEFELGIPPEQAMPEDFIYLTRIHYASPSDGMWGEHEMDYILFLRGDVLINPNENEVQDVQYVKREGFDKFLKELKESNIPITPWFHLVAQKFLPLWWKNLDNLKKFADHHHIHRMIE